MPHREGDDPRNVLLNQMNRPFADYALDTEAMTSWDGLIKLRNTVNAALETARSEKKIGKSLEAKVTIPSGRIAGCRTVETDELADLLIVSQADLSAEAADIQVEPAQGAKCERCWKILPSVGKSEDHPCLCARCAKVIRTLPL